MNKINVLKNELDSMIKTDANYKQIILKSIEIDCQILEGIRKVQKNEIKNIKDKEY